MTRRVAAIALLLGSLAACGGGDDDLVGPMVDSIPDAVEAIEQHYGAPQDYFQISAGLDAIGFVVAVDDATMAEQGSWTPDGGLVGPEAVGEAEGATFTADQIDLDPDAIFDEIKAELDDPAIVELVLIGSTDGVLYVATILSDSGGRLLVFVGPDGSIRSVQAE